MKPQRTELVPPALTDATAPPRGGRRDSTRGHRKYGKKITGLMGREESHGRAVNTIKMSQKSCQGQCQ